VQQDLDANLKAQEELWKQEFEELKSEYDKKMQEIIQLNRQAQQDKEQKWREEKQHLQHQLDFTQQQIEENRKMHKQLMAALQ